MKAGRIVSLLLASCLASSAGADVYRWTDDVGTIHFTDSPAQVPARERGTAVGLAWQGESRSKLQRIEKRAPAAAALLGFSRATRVPFGRQLNLIRVKVRLNDQLEVPFYLDTGSTDVVLTREVAARLGFHADEKTATATVTGLEGDVELPLMRLESVELGSARVTDLMTIVSPSLEIGLLGGSFFKNYVYAVDPTKGVLLIKPATR